VKQRPRDGGFRLRYSARELLALTTHPPGRLALRRMLFWSVWPLLRPLAWIWRRTVRRRLTVVAVSGSFGKTSTARLVSAAFGFDPSRLPVNFGSYLAKALLRAPRSAGQLVLEVGISRRGQMRRYARMLRPDVVVITAVGGEHRAALGGLDRIQEEKSELLAALRHDGVAILNGDDPRVLAMAPRAPGRVLTYGLSPGCDFRAEDVRLEWPRCTRFRALTPDRDLEVRLGLFGEHNVRGALAAIAVASVHGIDPATLLERLAAAPAARARLEALELANGAWMIRDDIKSGRETFDAAFALLAAVPARRRYMVLGDITEPEGSQSELYRELGRLAAGAASRLLFIGHGGRSVRRGARDAGLPPAAVTLCPDVTAATAILERELGAGDVVLVKGRANDKFERIALALTGRAVRCELRRCNILALECWRCPMLERGWGGRQPVT